MELKERIKYQEKFIEQMELYPRPMFHELQAADFHIAKKIFGESQYTGSQLIGFYKYFPHFFYQQVY